jgi:hypothetical protein
LTPEKRSDAIGERGVFPKGDLCPLTVISKGQNRSRNRRNEKKTIFSKPNPKKINKKQNL